VVSTPKQPDDDRRFNTLNKQRQQLQDQEQVHSIRTETNREQREYEQRKHRNNGTSTSCISPSNNHNCDCSSINSAICVSICRSRFVDGMRGVLDGMSNLHQDFDCLFTSLPGQSKLESRSLVPPSSVPLKRVVPLYQLNIDGSLLVVSIRGLDWSGTESSSQLLFFRLLVVF